ncbi:uncharacterized protein LOC125055774 [Pieris napi]|uniref:uncharacterized protein LOC125055774 n=1 Tax=Pieris napi TaxID=78633 RepID=UPI001FBBD1FF|nr:uncharacterized protein LOC125055774 [Pieris napi]
MTLLSSYTHLKQQVVYNVGSSDIQGNLLNQLKEFYRDDIDSTRRLEQIKTIGQLLRVLEIRDVLSENNVTPLKEIARRIKNNELLKKISEYEQSHDHREHLNFYAAENTQSSSYYKETETALPSGHPYGNITLRKKNRINETIVEQIGTSWRDLGRNLKLQEHRIDEIDKQQNSLKDKAYEILHVYEDRADPQRGFLVLCHALEKSRRKDLCRKLQEIMVMNI